MPARRNSKAKGPNIPVPEFTSDRMRLLGPMVTPRVIELARLRIGGRQKFFCGPKLVIDEDRAVLRLALIVARFMNPYEDYLLEEEALVRGVNCDTLRARRKQPGYRSL